MNNDLISRKALVEKLLMLDKTEPMQREISTAITTVLEQPCVDAELVRVGTRKAKIRHTCNGDRMSVICSECKHPFDDGKEICYNDEAGFLTAMTWLYINKEQLYCPHCGAKMELPKAPKEEENDK